MYTDQSDTLLHIHQSRDLTPGPVQAQYLRGLYRDRRADLVGWCSDIIPLNKRHQALYFKCGLQSFISVATLSTATARNSPGLHSHIMLILQGWYMPKGSAWCTNAGLMSYLAALRWCIMTTNEHGPWGIMRILTIEGPHSALMHYAHLLSWFMNAALASLLARAAFMHHDDPTGVYQPHRVIMMHDALKHLRHLTG